MRWLRCKPGAVARREWVIDASRREAGDRFLPIYARPASRTCRHAISASRPPDMSAELTTDLLPEPPAMEECNVCGEDAADTPGLKISRCSSCKNRFYCVRRDVDAVRPAYADTALAERAVPKGGLEEGAQVRLLAAQRTPPAARVHAGAARGGGPARVDALAGLADKGEREQRTQGSSGGDAAHPGYVRLSVVCVAC
jgi:hypothetical protein